jgi:hypothetical protein
VYSARFEHFARSASCRAGRCHAASQLRACVLCVLNRHDIDTWPAPALVGAAYPVPAHHAHDGYKLNQARVIGHDDFADYVLGAWDPRGAAHERYARPLQ